MKNKPVAFCDICGYFRAVYIVEDVKICCACAQKLRDMEKKRMKKHGRT